MKITHTIKETNKENNSQSGKEGFLETNPKKSNEELWEAIQIEGTPFTAVRHDKEWQLRLGRWAIKNGLSSFEECVADTEDKSWTRLTDIIYAVAKDVHEEYDIRSNMKGGNNE